ncbi:MAG: hypothetical protein V4726_15105 [Verrucomicrobiota bacterium]
MLAKFDIRLKSFNRSLSLLAIKEHMPVWKDQAPRIFTTKQGEAALMVAALTEAIRKQEAGLGGVAGEKDREETELEEAVYMVAQALVSWFTDKKQESGAGEVDLTMSEWRHMRDQRLLTKSERVMELAQSLVDGPEAAEAAKYGITPEAVTLLGKEWSDYDGIVNAPGVAQSLRRALTKGFPAALNLVESKFKELDRLIIQFARTEAGRSMIAAWKEARLKKGAGHSGGGGAQEEASAGPALPVSPAAGG